VATEKVVDLGAFRTKVRYGGRYDKGHCKHMRVTIDRDAGVIVCDDCEKPVSAFHLVVAWCEGWGEIAAAVTRQKERAVAISRMLRGYKVRLRALKDLEKYWWRGSQLPCCPHCRRGLLPEDFADGAGSMVSREYEMARRKRDAGAR
jgi:hypothetical protein